MTASISCVAVDILSHALASWAHIPWRHSKLSTNIELAREITTSEMNIRMKSPSNFPYLFSDQLV